MHIVHAADGGPVFVVAAVAVRVGCLFSRVGTIPVSGQQAGCRVRGVAQHIAGGIGLPILNGHDFPMNGDEGIAEAVEFRAAFAFGRLDHEGAGHGPAHGGGVVAVINEALGDIFDADPG